MTSRDPQIQRHGIRGWSRTRWLVLAGAVLAIVVVVLVVSMGGGGSGGGGGGGSWG
jgi:hypothetical protein